MRWKTKVSVLSILLLCTSVLLASSAPDDKALTSKDGAVFGAAAADTPEAAKELVRTEPKDVPSGDGSGGRQGGDTCATATVIPSVPYSDTGTTVGYVNDYDSGVVTGCPYSGSTALDVVYSYAPAADITVDISLCTNSAYDTKVYVFVDACPSAVLACSDDACSTPSFPSAYVSKILGAALTAGHTYYIVIDGYGSSSGAYTLDITPAVPPPGCPPGSLFSQPVEMVSWTGANSDQAGGYRIYDNYTVIGQICDIHWWGINAFFNGTSWAECVKDPEQFEIAFYADNGSGQPGSVVCGPYTVTPTKVDTGLTFGTYNLYYYSVPSLLPCCTLSSGWVSIMGLPNGQSCWDLWAAAVPGSGGSAWQENLTTGAFTAQTYDMSLCLTGEYEPSFGACCDDSTGMCTDNVELQNCLPPLRFAANTACGDLDPPCGLVTGACCHPDDTCEITTQAACTDLWLGAGTTCDQCPCIVPCPPEGIAEPEPCGTNQDGGCNSTPPVFAPINCGDTVCGTIYTTTSTRDTDWYELVLTAPSTLTWAVEAEFPVVAGLIEQNVCGLPGCGNITGYISPYATGAECSPISVTSACLPAGTYYLFVSHQDYPNFPCGTQNDYTATLTCEPCEPAFGACCYPDQSCADLPECACTGFYMGDGTECDTTECPIFPDECEDALDVGPLPATVTGDNTTATTGVQRTCVTSGPYRELWYTVTGTGNTMTASTIGGATWDTKLQVWCGDCDYLICVTGNDDSGGLQSLVTWCSSAGTTYYIVIGGYSTTAAGPFTMTVTDDGVPCTGAINCTIPTGACCVDGDCFVYTAAECAAASGSYGGDGTTCDPNPCGTGACCLWPSGECQDLSQVDCIDAGGNYQGNGTMCATTSCPTPGDTCEEPYVVVLPADLGVLFADTTCGRGNEYSNTCMGSYDGGEDMIFEVIVEEPLCVNITLDANNIYGAMAIDDTCPLGVGTNDCIAKAVTSADPDVITNLTLAAGTYWLQVDVWPSPTCVDFTLRFVECPPPPENDLCDDATDILALPYSQTGVNLPLATDDTNASPTCDATACTAANNGVWYTYTPDEDCTAAIVVSGGSLVTSIWTGPDCYNLTQVLCSDPDSFTIPLTAGTQYWILVSAYTCPADPTFLMNFSMDCQPPPPNDDCVTAEPLSVPGEVIVDHRFATDDPESTATCTTGALNQAVWYSVIGDGTTYTASTCNPGGSYNDTKLQVWCGDCDALHCVMGNDDMSTACGISTLRSRVIWCTRPGATYYIAAGGYSTNMGVIDLTVTSDGVPCTTADPACPGLCGDFDVDGDVDVNDFWTFMAAFGKCSGDPGYNPAADLDGDGCVTLVDYQMWIQCYRDANGGRNPPIQKWLKHPPTDRPRPTFGAGVSPALGGS